MNKNEFNVNELLASRSKLRGDYKTMAKAHAGIMEAIAKNSSRRMSDEELLSLNMIGHKLARIITGTAYDSDSWKDVAGYATLVVNTMEDNNENQ